MEEIEESFIEEDKIFTAKDKPYYQSYCGSTQKHLKFLTFKIISLSNYMLWGIVKLECCAYAALIN